MARNIKIKIDVDSDQVEFASDSTLTLTEKVRALRKELQRVPEGTAEWNTLNKAFNENKDALDRVNIKSRELFGTFSALPGPLGDIAGGLDRNIDLLKTFTSMKFSDVKSQVKGLYDDIKGLGKTLLDVTGITKVYTVLNNALGKSFIAVGVGEQAAAAGARSFAAALTATGVGALVVALGFGISKIYEWVTSTKDADAANAKLASSFDLLKQSIEDQQDAIAEDTKLLLIRAKTGGATAESLYQIEKLGLSKRVEANKEARKQIESEQLKLQLNSEISDEDRLKKQEEFNKLFVENSKKAGSLVSEGRLLEANRELSIAEKNRADLKTAADKNAADSKATVEKRKSDIKELEEAEHAALLSLMSNKDKELTEVDDKYKKLIDKENAYGRDTTVLVAARESAKQTIREKYAQEELDYINKALADSGDLQEKARQKDLSDAAAAYKKIFDQKVLAGEETTNIDKAYAQQQLDINAKHDETILKTKQDFYNKVAEIEIAAIANKKDRDLAQAQQDYDQALTDLTTNKEFLALEATDYEAALAVKEALLRGYNVKKAEIIKTAFEDEKAKTAKQNSDLLQLLSVQGESLVRGTKAYNDNRKAILDASQAQELNAIKVSADATIAEQERADAARTAINDKYTKLRKDQALQEAIYVAQQISQGLEAAKGVANAIQAVNEAKMAKELKAAGDDEAKKEEIKKKYFEKNKKTQIALAYINTFQAAVSAFASMAAIPVVGPALGAIAAAAAIVAGLANVAKIKASTYEGGSAGGAASASAPATVPMTAPEQTKIPTQEKSTVSAEGGIGNIINKGTTTAQQPNPFDKPKPMSVPVTLEKPKPMSVPVTLQAPKPVPIPNIGSAISNTTTQAQATGNAVGQAVAKQDTPIQTYVVGTQVSSQQQLDRRVSLAARMGG